MEAICVKATVTAAISCINHKASVDHAVSARPAGGGLPTPYLAAGGAAALAILGIGLAGARPDNASPAEPATGGSSSSSSSSSSSQSKSSSKGKDSHILSQSHLQVRLKSQMPHPMFEVECELRLLCVVCVPQEPMA